MLSLVCFIVGGLLGWGAAQGGARSQRVWPVVLRVQILVTSATLSLVAAWRLTSAGQLLGPLALSAGLWLMLGATLATRGRRSAGVGLARGVGREPQQRLLGRPGGDGLRRVDRDDDRRPGQRASPRPGGRWRST